LPGSLPGKLQRFLEAIPESIKSHPNKRLSQHLQDVWEFCWLLREKLNLPLETELIQIAAITHDIGKAHPQFQTYLSDEAVKKGPPHAAPSAWWALALACDMGIPLTKAFWGAEAVRRHHTGLEDYYEAILPYWASDHAANMWQSNWQSACGLLPKYQTTFELACLPQLPQLFWDIDQDPGLSNWFDLRLLLSVMVAADRMEALGVPFLDFHLLPSMKPVNFSEPEHPINRWRQETQHVTYQNALKKITSPGVYSLTLPTGAGKTHLGLEIASSLTNKFELKTLLYVLPFISIVEQTADTTRECFPQNMILEDHSLRPIHTEEDTNAWQRMIDLFRYWHSPITITTLAQFWEAIYASRANSSMNFHRLANAVILLDEPQTIPPPYWQGLGNMLSFLAEKFGTYFLLMTATQPQIRQYAGRGCEISPEIFHFPEIRHRYQISDLDSTQTLTDLEDLIIKEKLLDGKPQGLIVLNTKKAALAVFDLVQQILDGDLQQNLLFLSAWLTPYRRRKILQNLKELEKNNQPRILISTQVIEAGVDLDFDWVIRDMGPLDAIIQVAGRCNRHHKRDQQGRVYVANLIDEKTNRTFASYIYDSILLNATQEVLLPCNTFDEKKVPDLVKTYYQKILDRLTPAKIVQDLEQGKWGAPPQLYPESMIDQVQLIIEEEEEEEEEANVQVLARSLTETHWTLENLSMKKELIRRLRQFMIEIPRKVIPDIELVCSQTPHEEPLIKEISHSGMYILSKTMICKPGFEEEKPYIYHTIKGFVPPENLVDTTLIF
jgi:CRISPR-associated endonuclease/helicase Cas3